MMTRSVLRLIQSLLLSTLAVTALTAHAAPTLTPKTVFLGDVEGLSSRLMSFLAHSEAFERVGNSWKLKDGYTFVFSGDALDRGPNGREVLRTLNDLKSRYPDRVFWTLGNRDILKFHIVPQVSDERMRQPDAEFEQWLIKQGKDPKAEWTKEEKMRFTLRSTAAGALFEDYRTELLSEGLPADDSDIVKNILADLQTGGQLERFLAAGELGHVDEGTQTLFVHGAVNKANYGRVPAVPNVRFKRVRDWISALNQWAHAEIASGLAAQTPSHPGAAGLLKYIQRDPVTWENNASVVVARFFDGQGALIAPDRQFLEMLRAQGIRRIAVGHTPAGEIPLVMSVGGFEIVMVDQSFNSTGLSGAVTLTAKGTRMSSELLGFGHVTIDTEKGIPEHAGLLLGTGELVAGQLDSGEVVLFKKDSSFRPQYRAVSRAEVRRLLRPESCKAVFAGL